MYPKMFSTDFIFRQQENLVDNQKCQAGFRPLCNKILFPYHEISGPDICSLIWVQRAHVYLPLLLKNKRRKATNKLYHESKLLNLTIDLGQKSIEQMQDCEYRNNWKNLILLNLSIDWGQKSVESMQEK